MTGNIITQAVFTARHENGSPEWHALRATGIGGSEVGTICGLNKWESPFTLWAKKTGRIDNQIGANEAMEWGTRLEPVILDKFEDEHSELVLHREVGTWHHPDREWQLANPDAVFQQGDEFGIVEVKTAQFEDDWKDGVPRYYETQVQWYMHVFGYQRAFVIALFHGNRYREFEVQANGLAQDAALDRVEQFRKYVLDDIKPEFDGALNTYETVRALHPDITDDEVELGYLGVQYFDLATEAKAADEELNKLKSYILDAMGTAKKGMVDGEWAFTRSSRNGGTPYLTVKKG